LFAAVRRKNQESDEKHIDPDEKQSTSSIEIRAVVPST
jgi:hypothetical protein